MILILYKDFKPIKNVKVKQITKYSTGDIVYTDKDGNDITINIKEHNYFRVIEG